MDVDSLTKMLGDLWKDTLPNADKKDTSKVGVLDIREWYDDNGHNMSFNINGSIYTGLAGFVNWVRTSRESGITWPFHTVMYNGSKASAEQEKKLMDYANERLSEEE